MARLLRSITFLMLPLAVQLVNAAAGSAGSEDFDGLVDIGGGRNIVLLGPPGVGKTHLAIALGVLSAEMGYRVYFTSAIELARRMTRALAENRLPRKMKTLNRPKLLIIDEVGYLQLDPTLHRLGSRFRRRSDHG